MSQLRCHFGFFIFYVPYHRCVDSSDEDDDSEKESTPAKAGNGSMPGAAATERVQPVSAFLPPVLMQSSMWVVYLIFAPVLHVLYLPQSFFYHLQFCGLNVSLCGMQKVAEAMHICLRVECNWPSTCISYVLGWSIPSDRIRLLIVKLSLRSTVCKWSLCVIMWLSDWSMTVAFCCWCIYAGLCSPYLILATPTHPYLPV